MPSSKLGKIEVQGPSPPSEILKCNNRDGRGMWNVEKLVGMFETRSGRINSNYFGRGHRGTAGGQYDAWNRVGSK
jgi:hypothetical protein